MQRGLSACSLRRRIRVLTCLTTAAGWALTPTEAPDVSRAPLIAERFTPSTHLSLVVVRKQLLWD